MRNSLRIHGNWRLKTVAVIAAASFLTGTVQGARHVSIESKTASRFAAAWEHKDYKTMYGLIDDKTRERFSFSRFVQTYRTAAITATINSLSIGNPQENNSGKFSLPLSIDTKAFGKINGRVILPISHTGSKATVSWKPHLVFPYLKAGSSLHRETELPPRAAILARDGTPLARGSTDSSTLGQAAQQLVGSLGPPAQKRQKALYAAGVPLNATVGSSGLELAFDHLLIGRPGGRLSVGSKTIAQTRPKAAPALKTTIDAKLQSAAEAALAGRYGGIAALKPKTGEVLALAGIASAVLQPPGSTFKIVTLAAALEQRIATPSSNFPYETAATIEGVQLDNAHGESCGGTLTDSFAKSCNSVFAPLGAKIGGTKLVEMAERFGFNEKPTVPGAATSTIPSANTIGDSLAVGSSAIGQGLVQATPLQIASVAATVAAGGKRFKPTLLKSKQARPVRVISSKVAGTVERMMAATVRYGTGKAAAVPGVEIAGKTGTAELESRNDEPQSTESPQPGTDQDTPVQKPPDTDAWFTAYGTTKKPRIAVAVMLVNGGAGGDTAAPIARQVLLAGLGK